MAVQIRLARHGSKKTPFYRIVVTDRRNRRDGRFIENIGTFNPAAAKDGLTVNLERLDYWRKLGAQPSDTLAQLIKKQAAAAATAKA